MTWLAEGGGILTCTACGQSFSPPASCACTNQPQQLSSVAPPPSASVSGSRLAYIEQRVDACVGDLEWARQQMRASILRQRGDDNSHVELTEVQARREQGLVRGCKALCEAAKAELDVWTSREEVERLRRYNALREQEH